REDSYLSAWIGTHQDNREDKVLESKGAPIVGIFGNRDKDQILALGLVHLPYVASDEPAPIERPTTRRQQTKAESGEVGTEREAKATEAVEWPADKAPARSRSWLPYIVFGVVTVPMFVLLMLFLGRKKAVGIDARPRKPRPQKKPQTTEED